MLVLFGTRLVVPEVCINALGQNHIPPTCNHFMINFKKFHYWTKSLSEILVHSLTWHFNNFKTDSCIKKSTEIIDIVIVVDHCQEFFERCEIF